MILRRGIALAVVLWAAGARADYRLDSLEWNGLGMLVDEARAAGCALSAPEELDWSALGPRDVVWLLYPRTAIDPAALRRHLAAGGHVVLADDFGAAANALAALEITRATGPITDAPLFHDNPALPIAHPSLGTELGRSTLEIVANHPAWFVTALPATFAFSPTAALVVEGQIGRGGFVALSDPSVLINNMLELDGNRAFARALVQTTCHPGDRVLVLTGSFTVRGDGGAPEGLPFVRFNQMLVGLNGALAGGLRDDRALGVLALSVALAALIVFAGSFATRSPVADHWAALSAPLTAVETPYALRGLPWDFALPASVLRDEAVERLGAFAGSPVERLGPRELGRRVAARLGPLAGAEATELWRLVHRMGARPGHSPGRPVSRRELRRMHQLATTLFERLKTVAEK